MVVIPECLEREPRDFVALEHGGQALAVDWTVLAWLNDIRCTVEECNIAIFKVND
jgi:hypothetical protein